MRFAAFAVLFAAPLVAVAQDTQEGSTADILHRAIDQASQSSTLDIEGAVAQQSNLEDMIRDLQQQDNPQFGFLQRFGIGGALGPSGLFTGTISSNGDQMISLENETGTLEMFRRGERTVTRRTSLEDQPQEGGQGGDMERMARAFSGGRGLGREAERILALSWFSQNFGSLMNVAEGGREDVSGRACRLFSANAPEELVRVETPAPEEPQGGAPGEGPGRGGRGGFGRIFRQLGQPGLGGPLEEVRCQFWVDAEDLSLRKYRVDVVRGEPEWFDQVRNMMQLPADAVRSTSSYEIEIHGTHQGTVTFPPEIERFFQS